MVIRMKPNIEIVPSEAAVMKVLWDNEGMSAGSAEICAVLAKENGWARTTVTTLLRRLIDKGAVRVQKEHGYTYTALVTREEYTVSQTRHLINRVYEGSIKNLISTLCKSDELTVDDITELRAILSEEGTQHE